MTQTINQIHQALGQAIDAGLGDKPLEIPYDPGYATLGGLPAVKVKGVHMGFDWDHGRCFLAPDTRLGVPETILRKRLARIENLMGHMHLAASSGEADDAQRLERLRSYLRQLGEELAGGASDQAPG